MAVARVLGMIVSNPEGCRFEVTATGAAFVGGVDDGVERFGGGLAGEQHADVVHHDEARRALLHWRIAGREGLEDRGRGQISRLEVVEGGGHAKRGVVSVPSS